MTTDPQPVAAHQDLGRYRLFVFDFDGTLADSTPWMMSIMGEVARRHGLREVGEAEIQVLRGKSGREVMAYMNCPVWKLPAIARDVRRMSAEAADRIPLFPGVPELFARLAERGAAIAMVSSNGEATVRKVLGPALAGQVAHFACGAAMFGKAAKFRQVARRSRIPPGEVLCVGDEIRDIEAAREAGMACAAVLWGYATAEALQRARPDHAFGSVADLTAAL